MRILQIAPKVPYPPDDGSKVGIFNLTDQLLRRGVEICFAAPPNAGVADAQFRKRVDYIPLRIDNAYTIPGGIRNLFSGLPYNIEKYFDTAAADGLSRIYGTDKFDLVHVDHLHMAGYGLRLKEQYNARVVLREHNFESDIMGRVAHRTMNPFARSYYKMQHKRILRYEADVVRKVDLVLPISPVDEKKLRDLSPGIKSSVIPAGVDMEKYVPNVEFIPGRVLFLSSYKWYPNLDSMRFYVRKIAPLVNARLPQTKTIVAGKSINEIPESWLNGNFVKTGFVDDFNHLASMASIAVVPLRIGSGMRIKLLELMALGMGIVSTSIGAEGIDLESGKHLLVADTAEEFADKIVELLSSPSRCKELGNNARELIASKYTWDRAGEKLLDAYKSILGGDDCSN